MVSGKTDHFFCLLSSHAPPFGAWHQPVGSSDLMGFRTGTDMKTGSEDSKAYFRTKPSCHGSDVTPPDMKTGLSYSESYFRIKRTYSIACTAGIYPVKPANLIFERLIIKLWLTMNQTETL
jgi:hypothetical protein